MCSFLSAVVVCCMYDLLNVADWRGNFDMVRKCMNFWVPLLSCLPQLIDAILSSLWNREMKRTTRMQHNYMRHKKLSEIILWNSLVRETWSASITTQFLGSRSCFYPTKQELAYSIKLQMEISRSRAGFRKGDVIVVIKINSWIHRFQKWEWYGLKEGPE